MKLFKYQTNQFLPVKFDGITDVKLSDMKIRDGGGITSAAGMGILIYCSITKINHMSFDFYEPVYNQKPKKKTRQ